MQSWTSAMLKLLARICVSAQVLSKVLEAILHANTSLREMLRSSVYALCGTSLYDVQVQSIILLAILGEKLDICPPQPGLMDSLSLLPDAQLSLVFLNNLQQMPQDESHKSRTQVAVQVEYDKGCAHSSSDAVSAYDQYLAALVSAL